MKEKGEIMGHVRHDGSVEPVKIEDPRFGRYQVLVRREDLVFNTLKEGLVYPLKGFELELSKHLEKRGRP